MRRSIGKTVISRRLCRHIAREWVLAHGLAEWRRRVAAVERSDREYKAFAEQVGRPLNIDYAQRAELAGQMAEAAIWGYYDPPAPKIPGFFQRLRLSDWTPPLPSEQDWPMYTGER